MANSSQHAVNGRKALGNKLHRYAGWSERSLTPLGVAVLVVVIGLIVLLGFSLKSSLNDQAVQQQAANLEPSVPNFSRTFTTSDAVDFTQLTYDAYIAAVANVVPESKAKATGPPYDLTLMLRRLETIRPKLSSNLHKKLRDGYVRSASVATIGRDEVLCGKPDVSSVTTTLRLSGRDVAVVSVEKRYSAESAGALQATVDLKARVLTEITCN